jgi:hypothetical protein
LRLASAAPFSSASPAPVIHQLRGEKGGSLGDAEIQDLTCGLGDGGMEARAAEEAARGLLKSGKVVTTVTFAPRKLVAIEQAEYEVCEFLLHNLFIVHSLFTIFNSFWALIFKRRLKRSQRKRKATRYWRSTWLRRSRNSFRAETSRTKPL